jgi:hypothetical protein
MQRSPGPARPGLILFRRIEWHAYHRAWSNISNGDDDGHPTREDAAARHIHALYAVRPPVAKLKTRIRQPFPAVTLMIFTLLIRSESRRGWRGDKNRKAGVGASPFQMLTPSSSEPAGERNHILYGSISNWENKGRKSTKRKRETRGVGLPFFSALKPCIVRYVQIWEIIQLNAISKR